MLRSGPTCGAAAGSPPRRKTGWSRLPYSPVQGCPAVLCLLGLLATAGGCASRAPTGTRVDAESRLRFGDSGTSPLRDATAADSRANNTAADSRADKEERDAGRGGGDGRGADATAPEPRDALGLPTSRRQAVPLQIAADSSGIAALGFPHSEQDDLRAQSVFTATGNTPVLSVVLVAVDPARRYRVAGSFRSVGAEASTLYLGLAPYTAEPRFISVEQAERLGEAATIAAFAPTNLSTTAALTGWGNGGPAYARQLGFYFDGRTDHLPDAVWGHQPNTTADAYSTNPAFGAFSTAQGQTIALNAALPATISGRIAAGTTRVMNHTSGGTYLYTAASGVIVPTVWTRYEGEITGTAFNGGAKVFRPTTAYVRISLLLNYQQGTTARLHFTDLSLVALD